VRAVLEGEREFALAVLLPLSARRYS